MIQRSTQNPSMWAALARAIDAGQRLAADRFDLARLEARQDLATLIKGAVVLFVAAPIVLLGWLVLMGAVVVALTPAVPLWITLGIIGLLHMGAGAAAGFYGIRSIGERTAAPTNAERERLPVSTNGGSNVGQARQA